MAFDGIVTRAAVREMKEKIIQGKIERVYQPEADQLVLNIYTREGNHKLLMSAGTSHARVHFIESSPVNPTEPYAFCMLLRKHLQGARILDIIQKDSERIIEISFESLNELGFTVNKKLVIEIMGKHSNIILLDINTGNIIDSIKRISFDINRVRQILPGLKYEYPPAQDKLPLYELKPENEAYLTDAKSIVNRISGISPAFAEEISLKTNKLLFIEETLKKVDSGEIQPRIYSVKADGRNAGKKPEPKEYYLFPLSEYESCMETEVFETLSECLETYFDRKDSSNQGKVKSNRLIKTVSDNLNKKYLKKKRLSEELLRAEDSEELRLFGELLTANIHLVKPGMKQIDVVSYYDGSTVSIPLDVKKTPAKNAQQYYKKYGKAKTAVKEKQVQLHENEQEIKYLESVLTYLEQTDDVNEIESIRTELIETGYAKRKKKGGFKEKKSKPEPLQYTLSNGMKVLVGRNNRENDYITLKLARKGDIWMHTKDIPGSHVVVKTEGAELNETELFEAAGIAAFHSKWRDSENVPVDYVPVKYVKKPQGAKPGMVIFTNNRTVYVNPKEGEKNEKII